MWWAAYASASSMLGIAIVDAVCGTKALPGCTQVSASPLLQCRVKSEAAPGRQ